jgi:branched-chain amino acid transport system substrate-binding protein
MELTGENSILAPGLKASIEYKLDQVNSQVAGRKIQVLIEDGATDPTTSLDKAKKLIQQDKVDAILGPAWGPSAMAVANYLIPLKIPEIVFMNQSYGILKMAAENIFLPYGTTEGPGYPMGLYAYDKLGFRNAIVINEDFLSGHEFVGGAVKGFQSKGGNIVQTIAVKMGTMDFGPYLSTIQKADCVLFWFTPLLSQRFIIQYKDSGLQMPLIIPTASVLAPKALETMGDKSLGIMGSLLYTSLVDNEINRVYAANFTKKYNLIPNAQSLMGDVALSCYVEAVKATNGDTSSARINTALHNIKAPTPAGPWSFRSDGLGIADLYITKVSKTADRIDWNVIETYKQTNLDIPR